jgi:hypothetical protein
VSSQLDVDANGTSTFNGGHAKLNHHHFMKRRLVIITLTNMSTIITL